MGVAFAVGGFSLNGHAIRNRDRRGSIPLGADRKASNRIPEGALSRTLHCGQRPAGMNATRPVADGVTG